MLINKRNLNKESYLAPWLEVTIFGVEKGFAGTGADAPTETSEPGEDSSTPFNAPVYW